MPLIDPIIAGSKVESESLNQYSASSLDELIKMCGSGYRTSPMMKIVGLFLETIMIQKTVERDKMPQYHISNAFYSVERNFKQYASPDILKMSQKYIEIFNIDPSDKQMTFAPAIVTQFSGMDMSNILNVIYSTFFAGFTRAMSDVKYTKDQLMANDLVKQAYLDIKSTPLTETVDSKTEIYRIVSALTEISRIISYDKTQLTFHKTLTVDASMPRYNSYIFLNVFDDMFSTWLYGYRFNRCGYTTGSKFGMIATFTNILALYLIIVSKSLFGNTIISDYVSDKPWKPTITKAVNDSIDTVKNRPNGENFSDCAPCDNSNSYVESSLQDPQVAGFLTCVALYTRLCEFLTEITSVRNDDDWLFKNLENIVLPQHEPLLKFLKDAIDHFATVREDKKFKFSGEAMRTYLNNIYGLLKKSSLIASICPAHLSLEPTLDIFNMSSYSSVPIYHGKGIVKIMDIIKQCRINDSDGSYTNFITFTPSSWPYDKIVSMLSLYFRNEFDGDGFSLHDEYRTNTIANEKHTFALCDTSMLGIVSALASNPKLIYNTPFKNIIVNGIVDNMMLTLLNAHFKEDACMPLQLNAVSTIIAWISALSAGFSSFIADMKDRETINNCYFSQSGSTILLNLINTSVKISYRSTHLPQFQFRKAAIIENKVYDSVSDLNKRAKEDLIEITNRANKIDNQVATVTPNRYKNLIEYIGKALLNNCVHAEYMVFVLLQLYNDDMRTSLGFKDIYRNVSDVQPFRDVVKVLMREMGSRDNPLYALFQNPLEMWETRLLSKDISTDGIDTSESQKKLEPILEPVIFITILQRIVFTDEFNKQVNAKRSKAYFSSMSETISKVGENRVVNSAADRAYNETSRIRGISSSGQQSTVIMNDINEAVATVETTVSNVLNEGDWFVRNQEKLIPGSILSKVTTVTQESNT